ncbi:MAG: helix-turn-helix transcriptional regulator [Ruminiclostridium sp.]|nr:helix-turn-helix transcriptional regulator [Ruminiclostridium sp.]
MNQIEIGKFIAECRKSKNMTQNQLAERLNTTNKSVSKWENGICLPDASLYEPLCDILGITINELFAGHRIKNEDYKKTADENLMQMLKYKLYQLSDKSVAFSEFDNALNKIAEVTTMLKQFGTKQEAVNYLAKETDLPKEECSSAYDFYMKLFEIG